MKQTRAAVLRRRRLATSMSALAVIIVVAVLITQLGLSSHSHARPSTGVRQTNSPSTHAGGTGVVTGTTPSPLTAMRQAITAYVAHRHGAISVAVYDRNAKKLMLFHPKVRGRTASIVKVDILEDLAAQHRWSPQ